MVIFSPGPFKPVKLTGTVEPISTTSAAFGASTVNDGFGAIVNEPVVDVIVEVVASVTRSITLCPKALSAIVQEYGDDVTPVATDFQVAPPSIE